MTRYNLKFTAKKATGCDAFAEASEAELKVLVALLECGGVSDEDGLLAASGVSRSRLASAIALWLGEGILEEREETPYGNTVTEEFEERLFEGELLEQTAKETAQTIRNKNLAALIDECAKMVGKPMLSPMEIKRITQLSSQYALSEEYIAVLASYMMDKGTLTVLRLVNRAIKLVTERGIVTVEALEEYIATSERESRDVCELRRILGIYDRPFSTNETKYTRKWLYEFYFDTAVIAEAYDRAVDNTGKRSFSYMDKLLTDWHSAGCKNVAECRERCEQVSVEFKKNAAEKKTAGEKKGYSKPKADKPKFDASFDAEEAFRLAIARSFPDEKQEG